MSVVRARLLPYALPLRDPWPSAEGAVAERFGWILTLEDDHGRTGMGEAAPWPGFGLETVASAGAALRKALGYLVGVPSERMAQAIGELPRLAPVIAAPTARHAIDLALHDLIAQEAGLPIARWLGGSGTLDSVRANVALPRLPPETCAVRAARAVAAGATTVKLKVGGAPLALDVARVDAVRRAIGPATRLRVDANQAWSLDEAAAAIAALRPFDLEYVEQPVAASSLGALARLRATCGVPIAADESVRDLETARRVLDLGAADVLIVKPMALGGLYAARAVAALARERGAGAVVTSLLESAVGRTGALHAAASLGETPYAHGVSADDVLAQDLAEGPALERGSVRVPAAPGLGLGIEAGAWHKAVVAEAP